ncbi:hypothetical protein E4U13_005567, partial [Claviceps humidiphila]
TNLGQELRTLQFRHAAVGIGRRFVSNNFAKDYYKDEQVTSKSRKSQSRIRWRCQQAEDLQWAPDATATPVASTVVPTILLRQTQSPPLYELNVAEYTHTPPISSSSTVPSRQSKLQRPNSQQQEDRALRKALGLADPAPVAYKSPEQEQALKRIMNDTDPALVVVLSIGGGTASMPWATASLKISAMS